MVVDSANYFLPDFARAGAIHAGPFPALAVHVHDQVAAFRGRTGSSPERFRMITQRRNEKSLDSKTFALTLFPCVFAFLASLR